MRCFYFTSCGDRMVINQDALALPYRASAGETDAPREFLPFRALHALRRPQLCAVIDGMGGYTGGDVAARLVAETFSSVRCPDLVTEPFLTCLFETASAVGTVGITLGITPTLGIASKLIIICLMFFGRVGALTIVYAAVTGRSNKFSKYPLENITVG